MKTLPDTADWLTAERALEWEIDWILSGHHQRHLEFLLPRIEQYGVRRIAEFGCGGGLLAAALPKTVEYAGIDGYPKFLDTAKRRNPDRVFLLADIRSAPSEAYCDLAMAWNFLKNFGLHEWDQILAKILAAGRYAAFNVQTFHQEFDDGADYHNVYVTPERLERAICAAGHEIVDRVELSGWEIHGEMGRDIALWTQRQ